MAWRIAAYYEFNSSSRSKYAGNLPFFIKKSGSVAARVMPEPA
jgi:hypothetical protein